MRKNKVNMKNRWTDMLIKSESYEILHFINSQVTTEQEQKREKAAAMARIKSELEMQGFKKMAEDMRNKKQIVKLFQYYNTPN